ncbi:MAG TPA: type I polyketide synthase, partial [Povalibacter sp.]
MTDPAAHSAELSPLKRALLALDKMQTRIEALEGEKREPIAVLGIGCRFPGGVDSVASFWRLLDEGRDAVGSCPADRPGARIWEEAPFDAATAQLIRQGGFLRDVDQFDPGFFSISPREAARMDPQQRLLLQVACEALESAGLPIERIAGTKAGVFVGIHSQSSDYYLLQTAAPEEMDTYTSTGCAHSIVANRLSYTLDLRGPSVAVDTACSSSLVALHLACQSLRSRESDLALAGGVNLILAPETSFAFSRLEFLSAAGRCKTFDASANGFVRAEGCGVVALKRLSEALRDGDPVRAIIRGTALNQDGATNGLTAPNGLSQQSVIRAALENARVDPAQVTLIETHGTGTSLGDPIEVDALRAVFPPAGRRALGAVKTNIGHAEAAAGIAGVIKCVLALQHGKIPRNLHFKSLNPHIDLSGSEFFIPVETVPWESPSGPRCASVSSFGFGGTNGHVILQEAPVRSLVPQDAAPTPPTAVLLPLSARSVEALRALVSRWREFLERAAEALPPFSDIVSTAALRRSHHARRLALVGRDTEELSRKLAEIERNGVPTGVAQGREPDTAGRVAFVFSGQGPQWWAMGRELLATEAAYRSELERIDSLIQARVRFSILAELAKDESQSQLQRTDIAQPELFALQMGLVALWKSWGVEPEAAIGHSVGEVAAACTAGALTLEDAVTVVCHRGRLMHRPSGRGRMVAVEMPVAEARELVASYDGRVGIAAINTPESLTLSGEELAVNEMVAALEQRGVNCRLLKVDYAFHSPAMDAVKPELRDALRGIKPSSPSVLLISTVTGALAQAGDYGPDYWAQNIRQPVQFGAGVDLLIREGFNLFVEAAPHPVLSASVEQRLEAAGMRGGVLSSLRRGRPERETMLTALGALYVSGHPIAWNSLYRAPRQVVELPPYPWQQKSYWLKTSAPTRARLAPTPATEVPDDWYYDVAWEERPRVDAALSRGVGHHLTEPSEAARRLHPHAAALADAAGFAASRAAQAEVEKLATQFMADALERLGFDFAPGRTFSAEGLRAELGVRVRHSRLFARMLEVLAEEKLFARRGGEWQVVARKPASPTVPSAAAHGAEAALLVRCGGQLANVLRGEVDPLQLLFPEGDAPGAESIYRDSPSARFYNQFVAQIVRECVLRVPRGGTVQLLEVGA